MAGPARPAVLGALVAVALAVVGCGTPILDAPAPVPPAAAGSASASAAAGGPSAAPWEGTAPTASGPLAGLVAAPAASERPSRGGARLAPTASGPLDGRVIVVDPGHNGVAVPSILHRPVPQGGGATKACNTTGTEALDGTPEHALTWAVGVRLTGLLRAEGATVVLTRPDDAGVGPCVDERAAIANRAGADLVLSVHGDGADVAGARGFHVIVSDAMAGGPALERASRTAASALVAELGARTPLPRSTYLGGGTGIDARADIAGLNLLTGCPGVMLEMGNLRNAADWAYLGTDAGRAQVAAALAAAAGRVLG